MAKRMTRSELEEELESRKSGDRMEHEEFDDICSQERVHPSPCCDPKYCALAPFHEIDILREAIRVMKTQGGNIRVVEAIKYAEKRVLKRRAKRLETHSSLLRQQ